MPEDDPDFDPADAWNRIGRRATRGELDDIRFDLDEVFRETLTAIDRDALGPEELAALRREMNWARTYVEDVLTDLVDGAEKYDEDYRPNWPDQCCCESDSVQEDDDDE